MFCGMIFHELSLVVLLHIRPSQARRLDNIIRVLCHRLESSSRLPAPATRTPLEIYQHTLAMEIFGRLGKEGNDLIHQVAASIVGRTDGSSLTRKGACKERFFQIISVTAQVVVSHRVKR